MNCNSAQTADNANVDSKINKEVFNSWIAVTAIYHANPY